MPYQTSHTVAEAQQPNEVAPTLIRQQAVIADLSRKLLRCTDITAFFVDATSQIGTVIQAEMIHLLELLPDADSLVSRVCFSQTGMQITFPNQRLEANPTSPLGQLLRSAEPIIFEQEPFSLAGDQPASKPLNAHYLRLDYQDRPAGLLAIFQAEGQPLLDSEILFLQSVANLMSLALGQQQAKISTPKLLTFQTASAAIAATLNLEDVLPTVAREMIRLLAASGCIIYSWDQRQDTITVMIEVGPESWQLNPQTGYAYHLADYPFTHRVLRKQHPHQLTLAQPAIDQVERAYLIEKAYQSLLMLPLIYRGRTIGLLEVVDTETSRSFARPDIELAQHLASQAANAIENAKLYAEARRQLKEQEALLEAGMAISATLEIEVVLARLAEQMGRAVDATSAYIGDFDSEAATTTILAEYFAPEATARERISDLGTTYSTHSLYNFTERLHAAQPRVVHRDDPHLSAVEREHFFEFEAKTELTVPVHIGQQIMAYAIIWDSRHKRQFSQNEIALVQGIAQQAAIALKNAYLHAEMQQRTNQLATLLESTRTISSTLDLETILQLIARQMMRAAAASGCTILKWDHEQDAVVTWIAICEDAQTPTEAIGTTYALADYPASRRVLETRQPFTAYVDDPAVEPNELAMMQRIDIVGLLMLPLLIGGQVIGLVEVEREREKRVFLKTEIELCQALVNQAGVAIQNARLLSQTQQRLAEQIALRQAAEAISSTLDLETVLNRIAEQMGQAIDVTSAYISIYTPQDETITVRGEYLDPQANPRERVSDLGLSYSVPDYFPNLKEIIEAGQPGQSWIYDPETPQRHQDHLNQYGGVAELNIPLTVGEHFIGVASLWDSREGRRFTADEIAFCQSISQHAAIAIQNAQFYEQVQHYAGKLEQRVAERTTALTTVNANLQAQIAERERTEVALKETNAALQQRVDELAILNGIIQTLTTTTDLAVMLNSVARNIVHLFQAQQCGIALLNQARTASIVTAAYTEDESKPSAIGGVIPVANNPSATWMLEHKRPLLIPDPQHNLLTAPIQELMRQQKTECILIVPLLVRGEMIGTIGIDFDVPGRIFTPDEVRLAETITGQVAGIIDNARLLKEEQQQRQMAESLREVANVLNSNLDQGSILVKILEQLKRVVHYDGAGLFLQTGDDLVLVSNVTALVSVVGFHIPLASDDPAARVFKLKETVIIPDVRQDPGWAIWEGGEALRTWLGTPLLVNEKPIGVLTVDSFEIDAYDEADAQLLEAFANQATIAIQNARLFNREQQQRQIAEGLRQVSTVLSSSLDQVTVLGKILELLKLILTYDSAGLFLQKEESLILVSAVTEYDSFVGYQVSLDSNDPAARVFRSQQTLLIPNLELDPGWEMWADGKKTRTWLGTPLLANQKSMGVLTVDSFKVAAFGEAEARLLRTFADQAGLAIQNAYLFEREQRQRKIAESLREVSTALNQSLDPETVLNVIFDHLKQVIHYDGAGLFLKEKGQIILTAGRNLPQSFIGKVLPMNSANPTVKTLQTRRAIMVPDVHLDQGWKTWSGGEAIRAWMGAPMVIGDEVVGLLTLDNFLPNVYNEEDLQLLQLFANQAAIAIQNAKLYAEAQQEIAERTRAEAALIVARDQALEASQLKSELLAKVSHELRTPLGAILGYTEMLQEGVFGPISERQYKPTAEIVESAHYLTNLVNELLDQAQFDAGRLVLRADPFIPSDLIDLVLSQMKVLATAKGLELHTHLSPELPKMLVGDPIRIRQIMVNLISNAIKFTQTGAVDVYVFCPDDTHWSIQVSDTGPGIPVEAQTHIFEPFRQVDGSITREHGGTGLGLSIVKQLVVLMGGEIILESKVGHGSTFTVIFPQHPDSSQTKAHRSHTTDYT